MNNKSKHQLQHDDSMWKGAPQEIFLKAKELRKNMTTAEIMLWNVLKGNKLGGHKFRRQHPLGIYIVDFYNHKKKLAIELDGGYHETDEQKQKDLERETFLKFNDLHVIRFSNEIVITNLATVLDEINSKLDEI